MAEQEINSATGEIKLGYRPQDDAEVYAAEILGDSGASEKGS